MTVKEKIYNLKASAKQIANLPSGCFNSFTEDANMQEVLILLGEAERLEQIEMSRKKSVSL